MPGIFSVQTEALNILGEAAGARGRGSAIDGEANGRGAGDAEIKLRGIRRVKTRIIRIGEQSFGGRCESPAQHRLVNEVDPESWSVAAGYMADVIAKLVFLLISKHGKSGDGSDELIVAESFQAGDGARRGTKRKGEGEAQI